ncbi:MAG: Na+/H+ antiporter NhaA [Sphingomonas sp.]
MLRRAPSAMRDFLRSEAAGGIVLLAASAAALVVANLPGVAPAYFAALRFETGPAIAPAYGAMTVHLWINDALMALFFLLVGLEIKRELVDGRLASWERRLLPGVAAAAGMAVPALIYLAVTASTPGLANGWAIPAATDIAFAIGVLAILGRHAPGLAQAVADHGRDRRRHGRGGDHRGGLYAPSRPARARPARARRWRR